MKLKGPSSVDVFVKKPTAGVEGALIYGRDPGLVRERSRSLELAVLGAKPDPFGLVEIAEPTLKDAPGALYAESAAISMLGGRKFIRIRTGADLAAGALEAYLGEREAGNPGGDGFFVIEAGDLRGTSALLKLAEASSLVAAIPCYPDNEASLEMLVETALREAKVSIEPDAKALLIDRLGSDRGVSRQELDKLLLYVGAGGAHKATIRAEDVSEIVGDASAADLDKLIDAVFSGDVKETARLSARVAAAGSSEITVLRAVSRHLDQLSSPGAARGGGGGPYWERMQRHQARWPANLIARAESIVLNAELLCKTTGLPAEEICERALLGLAQGNAPR
jgi:DNA polymerase-3 subunit delta